MLPIAFQGLIPSKGISVLDRSFADFGLDMPHQFISTHGLDDFGVDAVFPLQKPQYYTFSGSGSAIFALAAYPKVSFIQFVFAFKFAPFQFGQMVQCLPQSLIDTDNHFDIYSQILRQPISGLELIESLQDCSLSTQPTQTFTLPEERTFHMPATRVQDFKGSTENTLAPAQKVGPTTKIRVSSCNHAPVSVHDGYETP